MEIHKLTQGKGQANMRSERGRGKREKERDHAKEITCVRKSARDRERESSRRSRSRGMKKMCVGKQWNIGKTLFKGNSAKETLNTTV